MSLPSDGHCEVLELTWKLISGEIDATESLRLDELVATDASLRRVYLNAIDLAAGLEWGEQVSQVRSWHADFPPGKAPRPRHEVAVSWIARGKSAWRRQSMLARVASIGLAAMVFYGTFTFLAWNLRPQKKLGDESLASQGSSEPPAQLTHADDAQWQHEAGAKSADRILRVHNGLAELKFAQGASVIIKGPAEFEARSENSGFLRRGKLIATVPMQAIGFTINTPTAEIVDLGTEFGVEVEESGTAEVHVFQGRVVAQFNGEGNRGSRRVELKASEAARFEAGETTVKRLTASAERFPQKSLEASPQLLTNQPDSVPGLQLWLKADAGVYSRFTDDGDDTNDTLAKPGDSVQGWRDFSGHARHAFQANTDNRPTLQLNILRSPVLRFEGNHWLERTGVVLNHTDPSRFTIMVAFEAAAFPGNKAAIFGQYSQAGDTNRYLGLDVSASLFYDEFRPLGGYLLGEKSSIATNVMYIGTLVRDGDARALHLATFGRGTVSNRLDSGEKYSGDAPVSWRVGTRWSPADLDAFRGEISELVIYDRALSQMERRNLEKYLTPKLFISKPKTSAKQP